MSYHCNIGTIAFMLRVKTKLGQSEKEGIGLFADEFVPAGTVTWHFDPEFDAAFDESAVARVPEHVRGQFLKYSYFDHTLGKYILCSDDQRFINHSDAPNILSTPERDVASRDIKQGEEMTCDYTKYEPGWFERRGIKREDFK
ncbi:MAG: SET domain-containing protein-lysine N-methyltransferase [Candidatus Taylorbacteria bacterium]|nr:SET domain-containing protein-lysine N-methyltransferase [Candidatus Taylorbacteria bacterium]